MQTFVLDEGIPSSDLSLSGKLRGFVKALFIKEIISNK